MSRHNIRSPLVSGGAAYMRVTPHQWFAWSSPGSQLSLRGGVLETEMGQFFRKWVVSEGLLPDNCRPDGDEVLFYANSRQRTFTTAKYFSAGFLPFANVEIQHKYEEDKMDPLFTAQFTKMNDAYRQQVIAEMNAIHGGPINLVYQSVSQLQNRTLLSLEEPPMVLPVTIEGLTANSDGLYRMADLDVRMAETMAEYDAIDDDEPTTTVPVPARIVPIGSARPYTLNGTQATDSFRGIVVNQGQKTVRRFRPAK